VINQACEDINRASEVTQITVGIERKLNSVSGNIESGEQRAQRSAKKNETV
jgi:hypothetical protein